MYGIIGGTGFERVFNGEANFIDTEYGRVPYYVSGDVIFVSRHGLNHQTPPHLINYRANIKAFQKLGVEFIISTAAVGSLNENFKPGEIVLMKDFLDFTNGRMSTFFEDETAHVKMDEPYCQHLNHILEENFGNLPYKGEAVYVATQGPRFETAAEIRFFKMIGGDVVGMTTVPEVVLAKELGICYSSVGVITNWATGLGVSADFEKISNSVVKIKEDFLDVLMSVFEKGIEYKDCHCRDSLVKF